MEHSYTFRRSERSDIPDLSNLLNQVFGVNRNIHYWEWKYFNNPAGRVLSALALINGRVVGQIGGIPVRFSIRGKEVIGAQEMDFSLLEEHRRYDLSLNMASLGKEIYLMENVDFSYGFSTGLTSEIVQTLKLKKKISPVPRLAKVLNVGPILKQRFPMNPLARILSLAANTALKMRYPERMVILEGMRIRQVDRFDERFDAFWNRIKADYPITTVKDSVYLNWRYVDIPHRDYEIISVEETQSGDIRGFIVFGEIWMDFLVGRIFDIVTSRTEGDMVTRCLLRYAINHFRKKKATIITCWMFPHCHIYPELIKAGFMPREEPGRDLLFQSINLQDPVIPEDVATDCKNWHISMGDCDMD